MTEANKRFPRALRQPLAADLALYPVVVVMGARQVGKTTLCLEVAEELGLTRRTLDDRDVREQARADPDGFLADLGTKGAFIDEVQRVPDLMLAIKAVVDRENRPGRFLLSGSNQPRMGRAVSDSLLGRATYRTLRPLTLSELRLDEQHRGWTFLFGGDTKAIIAEMERRAESSGPLDWRDAVRTGGFPRAVTAAPDQRARLLGDYVEIFSNRDARELIALESPARFEAFVRLAAARTGHELNASSISNDLGVPVSTVRRWLEVLQRAYLVDTVPAFSKNASQRVIKSPKIYSVDSALALAAARETAPTGFHLETMVAADLHVWKDGGPFRAVHHWRLQSGQEVDFVLESESGLVPVEVKASQAVATSDARHLRTFRERHSNVSAAVLLSCDPEIRHLGSGIVACPWWAIL